MSIARPTTHAIPANWKQGGYVDRVRKTPGAASILKARMQTSISGRGFTLVEVLIVVLIIAVLVALVSVKLAPDARQSLREEALRLATLLAHARDEAILTGAPLAWQRTETGYRFLERAADRTWKPIDRDASLRGRELPAGVGLAVIETAAPTSPAQPLIVLAPTGVTESFRIALALGEHRVHLRFDGAGPALVEEFAR
jgi:general secretion pathway protein H